METRENLVDTVFSLRRWTTFVPPLYKVESIKEKLYHHLLKI